jgi:hypothetical protein
MKSDSHVDIFFLGDTYFGEWHMQLRAKKQKSNILEEKGYLHFGKNFESLLSDADCVLVNLECAITDIAVSPLAQTGKGHIYSANEEGTIAALKALNVTAVGMANNHAVDYGKAGLMDTVRALDDAGIQYIGGGASDARAQEPLRFEKTCDGSIFKAAIVSTYNYGKQSEDYGFYAQEEIPGVNCQRLKSIATQIKNIKEIDSDCIFILSPHWGPNYSWRTFTQQRQAEELIQVGVDIIVGHSAHMIQEVEYIKGKLVAYSIGNFLMNGDGEYKRRNLPPYSFIARLHAENQNGEWMKSLFLYPFVSDNLATNFTPRFVNAVEFNQVLAILRNHNFEPMLFDQMVNVGSDQFGHYLRCTISTSQAQTQV